MGVLRHTNILFRHLATPDSEGFVIQAVEAAAMREFTQMLPEALCGELVTKAEKRSLAERIELMVLAAQTEIVRGVAEIIPCIADEIPAVIQKPKNECLQSYTLVGRADYVVTCHPDRLMPGQVRGPSIVTSRKPWEIPGK